MAESEERSFRDWLKVILPRVLKAAFWGFLMGGEFLILMYILPSIGGGFLEPFLSVRNDFSYLLFVFVGFEIVIQLTQGSILRYAFGMARALISVAVLFLASEGGIMRFSFSASPEIPLPSGLIVGLTVDFRIILGFFMIFSLLGIMKNVLQAINFLSEKSEDPIFLPKLP